MFRDGRFGLFGVGGTSSSNTSEVAWVELLTKFTNRNLLHTKCRKASFIYDIMLGIKENSDTSFSNLNSGLMVIEHNESGFYTFTFH